MNSTMTNTHTGRAPESRLDRQSVEATMGQLSTGHVENAGTASGSVARVRNHGPIAGFDAMARMPITCANAYAITKATWLHTPKFGPSDHFQRWRFTT